MAITTALAVTVGKHICQLKIAGLSGNAEMPTRTEVYMQKYRQGQRIGDETAKQNIILPRDRDNY